MNNERLIMKVLNYLLWVHQPRSERSEDDRDKLMVDLQLAINPIEKIPYEKSLTKKPKVFIERAAPLTKEGIRAVCGTEEEYNDSQYRSKQNG